MPKSLDRIAYRIDRNHKILSVENGWHDFAANNDAPELAGDNVIGHSLWKYIGDMTTRHLYMQMIDMAAAGNPVVFNFRCDGPARHRFSQMTIQLLSDGSIQFVTELITDGPCERQPLVARRNFDNGGLLTSCSWCNRVEVEEGVWEVVEKAVDSLGLFELEELPRLTHGICPECRGEMESVLAAMA
jgi:hypothetical protein